MKQIEVTDRVKKILDSYIDKHNETVYKYPHSVAAAAGKRTYSSIIMWLHEEVFYHREQTISDKDFG